MRFNQQKKDAIICYLLEKIDENAPNLVKTVSENFDINPNTVHAYMNELLAAGTIVRVKRGIYRLAEKVAMISLSRANGELRDEQQIYERHIRAYLQDLPQNVRMIWEYILGEMINNVIDHSAAERLEIVLMQSELKTKILIVDNGVGIFQKIVDHFQMASMDDAICELFKGKLTTDPVNHSGEGIFFSSRLADQFVIMSDGKFFSINKYDNDVLRDAPSESRGTTVFVELSNHSNKVSADVFNRYSEIEGGFRQTMIPLKSMFDSAPVSRSQAKRVCQRLDSFQEVTFDFEGLTWMGQGFAHQIFVVFQNAHPDIKLIPINMCKDVETMYCHVMQTKQ